MNDFQKFLDEKLESIQLDNGIINGDIADSYDIYQEIRDAITALRHDNHMTQKELASRTGLTQANISNLEKGSSKPTIETLKKIADAGIRQLKIGELKQVNLVVGDNNCGKTSVLEALQMLRTSGNLANVYRVARLRDLFLMEGRTGSCLIRKNCLPESTGSRI